MRLPSATVEVFAEGAGPTVLEAESRRLLGVLGGMGITTTLRRYERGEVVYRGEPDDGLYVLTAGAAKVTTRHSGDKRAVSRLIGPWEHFGRLWLVGEAGSDGRSERDGGEVAEAMAACEVEKVPKVFVRRAVRLRPGTALCLATLMESRLAGEEEFARCLLPRGTRERLARLLPLLLKKFGTRAPDGTGEIGLRLTRGGLAEMVASTRESVTKAVIELRDEGLVEMQSGRVVLPDPEALASIGGR